MSNNIERASILQRECQAEAESDYFYAKNVVKQEWPREQGVTWTNVEAPIIQEGPPKIVGLAVRTYNLKHMAINSPDLREDDHPDLAEFGLKQGVKYAWNEFFREEIVNVIENRFVTDVRPSSLMLLNSTIAIENYPRKVNIFGKRVSPWRTRRTRGGLLTLLNPKYRKAAQQVVGFHPDIVHFLFPDTSHWIGEFTWREDADCAIDSGFYRAIMTAAARPVRPDLGYVVTILPKGIRGWLYKWAWRIARFTP